MKAIIKFIDANLVTGITTLMVGTRLIDIKKETYQTLVRWAETWYDDCGLTIMSKPLHRKVFKFSSDGYVFKRDIANQIEKFLKGQSTWLN